MMLMDNVSLVMCFGEIFGKRLVASKEINLYQSNISSINSLEFFNWKSEIKFLTGRCRSRKFGVLWIATFFRVFGLNIPKCNAELQFCRYKLLFPIRIPEEAAKASNWAWKPTKTRRGQWTRDNSTLGPGQRRHIGVRLCNLTPMEGW